MEPISELRLELKEITKYTGTLYFTIYLALNVYIFTKIKQRGSITASFDRSALIITSVFLMSMILQVAEGFMTVNIVVVRQVRGVLSGVVWMLLAYFIFQMRTIRIKL